ncbi:hypothetical protein PHLCEN_2v1360 [Hermanssonia centrifuga]|uniref:Phosphatases II n=1 Tax=Hermanssonia centrifuga TaxID=98765 RepID=A0A2R6S3F9_9APHY|nr:hypothetical protein PHLCEN_2v1360 [Hermanssonia centrifuga]
MSSDSIALPEWLNRAQKDDYTVIKVIPTLTKRERERAAARAASRHKTHPSALHRVAHLPATSLADSNVTEHYSVSVACQPDNKQANRYDDVTPYDRTRVIIGHDGTEPSGRYINASWVREAAGRKWWIATQAPLPGTIHAFLSIILQPVSHPLPNQSPPASITGSTSRIRTVVQLTKNVESGMRKAHSYFPPEVGESWITSPEPGCNAPYLKVTFVDVKTFEESHCVQSTVSIQPLASLNSAEVQGEPVIFKHMLFSSWPDHSVPQPEDRVALLRFIRFVDETNRDISSQPAEVRDQLDPDPPVMVGCSAGIGRTGTFIALSSLFRFYRFLPPPASFLHEPDKDLPTLAPPPIGPLPDEIKDDLIVQEVDALREQRPGMVQRNDQLHLIYECLMTAFAQHMNGAENST